MEERPIAAENKGIRRGMCYKSVVYVEYKQLRLPQRVTCCLVFELSDLDYICRHMSLKASKGHSFKNFPPERREIIIPRPACFALPQDKDREKDPDLRHVSE